MDEQLSEEAAAGFDREGLNSKVKMQRDEIEELKIELAAREEAVAQGEYAINWVQEQIRANRILIDENGRPNIIRNESDLNDDDHRQF